MSPTRYLGVDAGNSKTVAVLADAAGTVLGWGRAGCGDIYADTEDTAVDEVLAAVVAAAGSGDVGGHVGAQSDSPLRAAMCLAGIDWPEDVSYWRSTIAERLPALVGCSLRNDGFGLLRAGAVDGLGVAVSVGTGAAVVARGPSGTEWSGSMWITDPGGGLDLGRAALRAVVRAELDLGPPTELQVTLPGVHGTSSPAELLHRATRRRPDRAVRHSDAARAVLTAAERGDTVAGAIVDRQATSLAGYVGVAARQVGLGHLERVPVVLGGSIALAAGSPLAAAFRAALAAQLPAASLTLTPRPPVVGALLQALAEDGVPLSADVLARLDASPLPTDLLRT